MLVFTLQDDDTFVEEAFSYSELRSPNKREEVLKILIKWAGNDEETIIWHQAQALTKNAWK